METIKLNTIEEAVADFKAGKFVIVVDDEDRENEGDLICAAEKITPEMVNFMLKHARGLLCAPVTISRSRELDLPHQVQDNTSLLGTPFTVTVDKIEGCSTGVSAHDRAATIRALADPQSKPETFGRPGHVNPLYAQDNGVLRRSGHTEAAIDLCKLAGLYPAGALMEIMNDDGTMARMPQLMAFAKQWDMKVITIKEVQLSATIADHDVEVKQKAAEKFLRDGDKVKVSIRFRGRQITHSEIGLDIMKDFAERCKDFAVVERKPLTEGRNMTMILAPKE
jgi:3,4-dihydroxy 2-butanone 4-phosphate synthase/GTP cyclohydrolase II